MKGYYGFPLNKVQKPALRVYAHWETGSWAKGESVLIPCGSKGEHLSGQGLFNQGFVVNKM